MSYTSDRYYISDEVLYARVEIPERVMIENESLAMDSAMRQLADMIARELLTNGCIKWDVQQNYDTMSYEIRACLQVIKP